MCAVDLLWRKAHSLKAVLLAPGVRCVLAFALPGYLIGGLFPEVGTGPLGRGGSLRWLCGYQPGDEELHHGAVVFRA